MGQMIQRKSKKMTFIQHMRTQLLAAEMFKMIIADFIKYLHKDVSYIADKYDDHSIILCSVQKWRTPSHYIFIFGQHNNLFDRAHLLL